MTLISAEYEVGAFSVPGEESIFGSKDADIDRIEYRRRSRLSKDGVVSGLEDGLRRGKQIDEGDSGRALSVTSVAWDKGIIGLFSLVTADISSSRKGLTDHKTGVGKLNSPDILPTSQPLSVIETKRK